MAADVGQFSVGAFATGTSVATAGIVTAASGSSFLIFAIDDSSSRSVSDNKGNTYSLVGSTLTNWLGFGINLSIWLCTHGTGGSAHSATLTPGGSADLECYLIEITGGAAASLVDALSSAFWNDDAATPFTSNNVVTSNAADLLLAFTVTDISLTETLTWGNGFAAVTADGNPSHFGSGIAKQLVSSAGTYSSSFTSSNAVRAATAVIALKSAPPAGAALAGAGPSVASATGALSTGIQLAGTPTSVSSATGFLMGLMGAAAASSSGTGALSTAIQLAAAALSTTTAQATLNGSVNLAGSASSVTSAASVLTNWTTVTLTAPLYTGPQGILDPHLWAGGSKPVVGSVIYYDATHMTVSANGELGADVTDCSAVMQFQDTGGQWSEATVYFTSGLAVYVDTVATATGAMTTAIRLLGAASALVTAVGGLNAQIQLRGSLASVATAQANLVTAILLAGSIVDSTNAVGALAGTDNTLAGNAVVTSTAAGLLNAQIRLVGAAAALVTAVGALATQIKLQSAVLSTTGASGSLSAGTQLNAAATVAVTATGALLTGIKVAGAAVLIVQAAGDLTAHIQLVGAAIAVSVATGDLTAHTGIGGIAQSVATATGALTSLITLRAAAFSDTAAGSALLTQIPLQGGALVTDSASGDLTSTGSPVGLYPIDPYFVIGVRRQYYTSRFPQVGPNEPKVLTFNFADELPAGTTLNGIISVNVVSSAGVDPGLPDSLLSAPAAYDITRTEVVVPVHPGLKDVDYYFTVTAPVSQYESLTRFGLLSVRG